MDSRIYRNVQMTNKTTGKQVCDFLMSVKSELKFKGIFLDIETLEKDDWKLKATDSKVGKCENIRLFIANNRLYITTDYTMGTFPIHEEGAIDAFCEITQSILERSSSSG